MYAQLDQAESEMEQMARATSVVVHRSAPHGPWSSGAGYFICDHHDRVLYPASLSARDHGATAEEANGWLKTRCPA